MLTIKDKTPSVVQCEQPGILKVEEFNDGQQDEENKIK